LHCGKEWFYNNLIHLWQLSTDLGKYLTDQRQTLYVAFETKASGKLFSKFGYYSYKQGDGDNELINYLEKKTTYLQITNMPEAGVFVFPVLSSHLNCGLSSPAKAAEASLKNTLLYCDELCCTPVGSDGEGTGAAHSEFLWMATPRPGKLNMHLHMNKLSCGYAYEKNDGPVTLKALTAVLRAFSGDSSLQPRRAVATKLVGSTKSGHKRFVTWSDECHIPANALERGREEVRSKERKRLSKQICQLTAKRTKRAAAYKEAVDVQFHLLLEKAANSNPILAGGPVSFVAGGPLGTCAVPYFDLAMHQARHRCLQDQILERDEELCKLHIKLHQLNDD
jgi:hypothetical protein